MSEALAEVVVRRVEDRLPVVSLDDDRLLDNQGDPVLCECTSSLSFEDGEIVLSPSQVYGRHASLAVGAEDMLRLLSKGNFVLAAETDEKSSQLPEIGQRVPTSARINGIIAGWSDGNITPEEHVETIDLYVYNSLIDGEGIHLNEDSLVCIGDGGGRCQALMHDRVGHTRKRKVLFQLNIDLNGNLSRMLKVFLKTNRDAKRLSKGTVLGVENALLRNNPEMVPTGWDDKMTPTYLATKLWQRREGKTWLSLVGWKTEAGRLQGAQGDISNVATAIHSMRKHIIEERYTLDNVVDALDFGFRYFYMACPKCVEDVLHNHGKETRFHTTLACRLIILLTSKLYRHCIQRDAKSRMREFGALVNDTLTRHFNHHSDDYKKSKAARMEADRFFRESNFFNSKSFNSGMVATTKLINTMIQCCKEAVRG